MSEKQDPNDLFDAPQFLEYKKALTMNEDEITH